jgi:flavin-dependent dehydrogenase
VTACEVLIVGGGPGGSTCAWALRRAGVDVLVMDRARFPRDKICAGWITPHVVDALELNTRDYASDGLTLQPMTGFRTGVVEGPAVDTSYDRIVSYGIRRCEFDHYLLQRSQARLLTETPLRSLVRRDGMWVANEEITAPVVIGAGGHFCPVAKMLGRSSQPDGLIVAQEAELRLPDPTVCDVSATRPELYFCGDLEGYGWCVRKGDYLNVGLGRRENGAFPAHVREFAAWLERSGRAPALATKARWKGHAYLLAGSVSTALVDDGLLLIGDAAGLAYPESGEGIRTAVESGLLAAHTLLATRGRRRADLIGYEQTLRGNQPSGRIADLLPRSVVRFLGRWLLGNPQFTRRVVLDRWFLRLNASPKAAFDTAA